MNNKGFTLVEILAVIIILGVLTLLAIPRVTEYTENSRISVYATSAKQFMDSVKQEVNNQSDGYRVKVGSCINVKISDIELDNGSNLKSPYGEYLDDYSYITVININGNYLYMLTLVDSLGYGWMYEEYSEVSKHNLLRKIMLDAIVPVSDDACTVSLPYGDIDRNGKLNGSDSSFIRKYINGQAELTTMQKILADVNFDGEIDERDINTINQCVSGLSVCEIKYFS